MSLHEASDQTAIPHDMVKLGSAGLLSLTSLTSALSTFLRSPSELEFTTYKAGQHAYQLTLPLRKLDHDECPTQTQLPRDLDSIAARIHADALSDPSTECGEVSSARSFLDTLENYRDLTDPGCDHDTWVQIIDGVKSYVDPLQQAACGSTV